MKLFKTIAATGYYLLHGQPTANASIRFDLEGDMHSMLICNENDPYIYANNDRTWNHSTSSFTRTADGQLARGRCDLVILDTADEYTNVTSYKIARGEKDLKMRSVGWDILFDKAKPNPSKYNNPRPLASSCIGQLQNIPVDKIKSYCFK